VIDLGRLKIEHQLAAGSQGKVFLAKDPDGTRFAVKLILLDEKANRGQIFERAGAFGIDLLDQSVAPILSYGMVPNAPAEFQRQLGKMSKEAILIVTPFVEGSTLADLALQEPFNARGAAAALAGIALALTKLPAGVGHGDLRATNIFVRPSGGVVLVDPDLWRRPDPENDLRALAAIGLSILKPGQPDEGTVLVRRLRALLEELALPGTSPTPTEAAERLAEIAIGLGAPAGNLTAPLAKRARRSETRPPIPPAAALLAAPPPQEEEEDVEAPSRRRRWWILSGVLAAVAIAAVAYRPRPAPHASRPRDAPEGLYDETGTVTYPGQLHELASGERVAAGDGFINVTFEYAMPRLAVLTPRGDVLWERKRPEPGSNFYLDVKPDHYLVEQDRELGKDKLQKDVKQFLVDREHPLRVNATAKMLLSPRPVGDSGFP